MLKAANVMLSLSPNHWFFSAQSSLLGSGIGCVWGWKACSKLSFSWIAGADANLCLEELTLFSSTAILAKMSWAFATLSKSETSWAFFNADIACAFWDFNLVSASSK